MTPPVAVNCQWISEVEMLRKTSSLRILLLAASLLAGCAARESTSQAPPAADGGSLSGHAKRGMEKPKVQNFLDEIGKFYVQYNTENGRSPANWNEFKAYIQKDAPKIVQTVEQGSCEIIWNAKLGSDVVIAYEKEPDIRGTQVVVFGDGHIESISPAKLQEALQRK
jgi:hypothetical protein